MGEENKPCISTPSGDNKTDACPGGGMIAVLAIAGIKDTSQENSRGRPKRLSSIPLTILAHMMLLSLVSPSRTLPTIYN
jgi:hypothetical protein